MAENTTTVPLPELWQRAKKAGYREQDFLGGLKAEYGVDAEALWPKAKKAGYSWDQFLTSMDEEYKPTRRNAAAPLPDDWGTDETTQPPKAKPQDLREPIELPPFEVEEPNLFLPTPEEMKEGINKGLGAVKDFADRPGVRTAIRTAEARDAVRQVFEPTYEERYKKTFGDRSPTEGPADSLLRGVPRVAGMAWGIPRQVGEELAHVAEMATESIDNLTGGKAAMPANLTPKQQVLWKMQQGIEVPDDEYLAANFQGEQDAKAIEQAQKTGKTPLKKTTTSKVAEAYARQEDEIRKYLPDSILINTGRDIADNVEGLALLAAMALGGKVSPAERKAEAAGTWEGIKANFAAGDEFGGELLGGAIGGTAALFANFGDALETRPFSMVLNLVPVAKALRLAQTEAAAMGSAGAARLKALNNPSLNKALALVERVDAEVRKAPKRAKEVLSPETTFQLERIAAGAARFFTDRSRQIEASAEGMIRDMFRRASEDKATVAGAGERIAAQTQKGGLAEVRGPEGNLKLDAPQEVTTKPAQVEAGTGRMTDDVLTAAEETQLSEMTRGNQRLSPAEQAKLKEDMKQLLLEKQEKEGVVVSDLDQLDPTSPVAANDNKLNPYLDLIDGLPEPVWDAVFREAARDKAGKTGVPEASVKVTKQEVADYLHAKWGDPPKAPDAPTPLKKMEAANDWPPSDPYTPARIVDDVVVRTAQANPEVVRIMTEAASRLTGDPIANTAAMETALVRAVTPALPDMLASSRLRPGVVEAIVRFAEAEGVRGPALDRVRQTADAALQRAAREGDLEFKITVSQDGIVDAIRQRAAQGSPEAANLLRQAGETVSSRRPIDITPKVIEAVVDEALKDPALRQVALTESVLDATQRMANQREQQAFRQVFNEHLDDARAVAVENPSEQFSAIVERGLPAVLASDPAKLLNQIINDEAGLAKIMSAPDGYGMTPAQAARGIRDIKARLDNYEAMEPKVRDHLGLGRDEPIFVPKGVNQTLRWHVEALEALESNSGWRKLQTMIKANLTARNLSTALGNLQANLAMQMLRRGQPMVIADLVKFDRLWQDFKKGALKDPETVQMLEAIERTGVMDTTLIEGELGGLRRSGFLDAMADKPFGLGVVAKGLNKVRDALGSDRNPLRHLGPEALEKFYRAGDNWFKGEEAVRNFKWLKDKLDVLEDGKWIELRVGAGPKERVRLQRAGDGFTLNGKPVPPAKIPDILARAATRPALDLFFDYSDVPGMVSKLKTAPIIGLGSPFYTFFHKSLWIPGVKRGLPREMMSSHPEILSNSRAVNAGRLADATGVAARQSLLITGMRQHLLTEEGRDEMKKVLAWAPREAQIRLLDHATNPLWTETLDLTRINFGSSTDLLFRGLAAGLSPDTAASMAQIDELYPIEPETGARDLDLADLKKSDPEHYQQIMARRQFWRKYHGGEVITGKDAFTLIGLAGSPLLDILQKADQAERSGRSFAGPALIQTLGPMLMGGTYYRVTDAVLGASDPTSALSSRQWALNPIGDPQEDLLRWAIRRVTGVGWAPKDIQASRERYFTRLKRAWSNSLTDDLEREARLYEEKVGDLGKANAIRANIERINEIIDYEIELMEDQWESIFNIRAQNRAKEMEKQGLEKKPKPSSPATGEPKSGVVADPQPARKTAAEKLYEEMVRKEKEAEQVRRQGGTIP